MVRNNIKKNSTKSISGQAFKKILYMGKKKIKKREEYFQTVKKTLPCASRIREANKTKTRRKNTDSIFTTGFRKLRKDGLVVLHSSKKLCQGGSIAGVNHELSLDI